MSINFVFALMFANVLNVLAGRVLLTLYALDLGAQPHTIGLLAATFALFPMLLSWFGGRLSDRFGPRRPLMVGAIGAGFGMLVPYFWPSLGAVFVAAGMSGFSLAFFTAATQNLVGTLSNSSNRAKNFSNYTLFGSVASFVGPLLIGFSIDHGGYGTSFLCLVALAVVPIVMLAIWGGRLPPARTGVAATGSIRQLLRDPSILRVLTVSSLAQSGHNIFQFYMPVHGHALGLSASVIGTVLAMFAAGSFLSRMSLPWFIVRHTKQQILSWTFGLGAVCFILIPFFQGAVILAALTFLFGFGINCSQPLAIILMYSHSPEGRSGEALGLRLTTDNVTKLASPIVFGVVASASGIAAVFWISALLLAAGAALSRSAKLSEGSVKEARPI